MTEMIYFCAKMIIKPNTSNMKRFIIASILLAVAFSLNAQDLAAPTLSYSGLEKKLKKSDEEINDAKEKVKPATWFSRGEIFLDIHEVNIEFIRLGMPSAEAKLYLKEPNEVNTVEEDGRTFEHYVYDRITLIFENNLLEDYRETQVIHPDPLPAALDAFKETLRLDEKKKLVKKVQEQLENMKVA